MGNNQVCCNYKPKDPHAQDFDGPPKIEGIQKNKELDDLLKKSKDHNNKIVKIQSVFRGYVQRKKMNKNNGEADGKP